MQDILKTMKIRVPSWSIQRKKKRKEKKKYYEILYKSNNSYWFWRKHFTEAWLKSVIIKGGLTPSAYNAIFLNFCHSGNTIQYIKQMK